MDTVVFTSVQFLTGFWLQSAFRKINSGLPSTHDKSSQYGFQNVCSALTAYHPDFNCSNKTDSLKIFLPYIRPAKNK